MVQWRIWAQLTLAALAGPLPDQAVRYECVPAKAVLLEATDAELASALASARAVRARLAGWQTPA